MDAEFIIAARDARWARAMMWIAIVWFAAMVNLLIIYPSDIDLWRGATFAFLSIFMTVGVTEAEWSQYEEGLRNTRRMMRENERVGW